jgi:VanZ family protein
MHRGPSGLRAWGAAGLWALLVWSLGDDGFSANRTSRVLGPLVAWLFPDLSDAATAQLLFTLRKTAHVVEYAILAGLSYRALRISWPADWRWMAPATVALVATLAGADELRQSLSDDRTGSVWDVLLDCAGGALGLLAVAALPHGLRERYFPTRARGE